MDEAHRKRISEALGRIPSGLFVLTAQHEDRRMGMLTSFVQQVCFEPPMVSVAVAKGRPIMPLISESRRFALCQVSDHDKLILRKFANGVPANEDPFLGLELVTGQLPGLPILARAMAYLECELACHMDVEGDHDLFVGVVRGANCVPGVTPHVRIRENGFQY
ncbi:MAG TPA: flavin reductase family protein [Phycisphaeraceae bacterium]